MDPNGESRRPAVDLKEALKNPEDPKLLEWIKTLGKIHKEQPALSEGRYQELLLTNRQYAFARILGEEGVVVAVNNDDKPAELRIRQPLDGKSYTSLIDGTEGIVENGNLCVTLQPNESQIFAFA